jgi:hypothetical protein
MSETTQMTQATTRSEHSRGRSYRKLLTAITLGLLALLVLAMPALAGRAWCAKDPIVSLNGTQVQMWVAIPEEYVQYVSGPIKMTISTPASVDREVIFLDEGFNGYGEEVRWADLTTPTGGLLGALLGASQPALVAADGSFDVVVQSTVPINKNLLFNLLGTRTIPLQLTIVFADGSTRMVEMKNDGAKIAFRVQGQP